MRANTVADVVIAGGGIIGLSLGLELLERGLSVTVVERQQAMSSASSAAGGMLAARDPQNPAKLMPLALRSEELYPAYLSRIERLSGKAVPIRTRWAMQHVPVALPGAKIAGAAELAEFAPGLNLGNQLFEWLQEGSVDPNDLRQALPLAFVAAGGVLLEHTEVQRIEPNDGVRVCTSSGYVHAGEFVNCCGAWAGGAVQGLEKLPVEPVKGQMANLRCAPDRLRCVVRAPGVYLIPRGDGRVTIGATIEHAGFDKSVNDSAVRRLVSAALALLPEAEAPAEMDMWAGLRPGTPDMLPVLGTAEKHHCWHATGHYRDGILLAPVSARIVAQAIAGETPDVPLEPYASARFAVVPR
ncbi:MAG TPA: FAD-dependent oxidoreductase [Acidobacteriaceae bacterium]|nr:FAD-dependent oxidoreductase [Acidobacteriaceae bacterium]